MVIYLISCLIFNVLFFIRGDEVYIYIVVCGGDVVVVINVLGGRRRS